MTRHERIVLDLRGGPRDGSRRDLGDSTDGRWPAEYVVPRWPLMPGETTGGGNLGGRYLRTDQWTNGAEARIYVWQPEARPEG